MSCDFAILSLDEVLTDSEVSLLYQELIDGNISGVSPNKSISDFYGELTKLHPEIDDVPDELIDDIDHCPWSVAFDKSDGHLIICCVWPKADYVLGLLYSLTNKHNLVMFDPQSEVIVNRDDLNGWARSKPWWKFW